MRKKGLLRKRILICILGATMVFTSTGTSVAMAAETESTNELENDTLFSGKVICESVVPCEVKELENDVETSQYEEENLQYDIESYTSSDDTDGLDNTENSGDTKDSGNTENSDNADDSDNTDNSDDTNDSDETEELTWKNTKTVVSTNTFWKGNSEYEYAEGTKLRMERSDGFWMEIYSHIWVTNHRNDNCSFCRDNGAKAENGWHITKKDTSTSSYGSDYIHSNTTYDYKTMTQFLALKSTKLRSYNNSAWVSVTAKLDGKVTNFRCLSFISTDAETGERTQYFRYIMNGGPIVAHIKLDDDIAYYSDYILAPGMAGVHGHYKWDGTKSYDWLGVMDRILIQSDTNIYSGFDTKHTGFYGPLLEVGDAAFENGKGPNVDNGDGSENTELPGAGNETGGSENDAAYNDNSFEDINTLGAYVTLKTDCIKVKKNNAAQKPLPTKVTVNGTALKRGKTYALSYEKYENSAWTEVNAITGEGTYRMCITGMGGYEGKCTKRIYVTADKSIKAMSSAKVKVNKMAYMGAEIKDGVIKSVKLGRRELYEGTDYTTVYANNVDSGTGTITLIATKGSGLLGTKIVNFTITGNKISKAKVDGISNVVYNPESGMVQDMSNITVTYNGSLLKEGTDFTVSYTGNTKAGIAKMIFTGKGLYNGTLKKNFKITKAVLSADMLDEKSKDIVEQYTGKVLKPSVSLKNGSVELVKGTDYTLSYVNNKKLSTDSAPAKIIVKGKGSYTGTLNVNFMIKDKSSTKDTQKATSVKDEVDVDETPAADEVTDEDVTEENEETATEETADEGDAEETEEGNTDTDNSNNDTSEDTEQPETDNGNTDNDNADVGSTDNSDTDTNSTDNNDPGIDTDDTDSSDIDTDTDTDENDSEAADIADETLIDSADGEDADVESNDGSITDSEETLTEDTELDVVETQLSEEVDVQETVESAIYNAT